MSRQQTALITGASQGLGLSVAKILSQQGMKLLLTGRSFEKLRLCTKDLRDSVRHELLVVDLCDKHSLSTMLAELDSKNILPDVIIHCLGGKVQSDKQPLNAEVLQESISLNLGVAAQINAYFLPKMSLREKGCIVHVSSDASITGDSAPGYAAAKAAVNAYVKSTARFYASSQIMICAILPGIFEHANCAWTQKKISDPEHYRNKLGLMPLGRFAQCTEIADIIGDIVYRQNMVYSGSLIELAGR